MEGRDGGEEERMTGEKRKIGRRRRGEDTVEMWKVGMGEKRRG